MRRYTPGLFAGLDRDNYEGQGLFAQFEEFVAGRASREDGQSAYRGEGEG